MRVHGQQSHDRAEAASTSPEPQLQRLVLGLPGQGACRAKRTAVRVHTEVPHGGWSQGRLRAAPPASGGSEDSKSEPGFQAIITKVKVGGENTFY